MKRIIAPLMLVAVAGCATPSTGTAEPPAAGAVQPSEQPAAKTAPKATHRAKRWVTVATLKGTSDKRGAPFHLSGGEARLTYRIKDTSGMNAVIFAVYLVDKGESLAKAGGIPEVTATDPGKDTTRLAKDEGDYYLDVSAANASWTVTIQEKR